MPAVGLIGKREQTAHLLRIYPAQAGNLARGGGAMKKNKPPYTDPPHDLPPDLQQAVKKALAATNNLCPPPRYDAAYWREEREAIAHLAVWQAAEAYQENEGVSREAFAVVCAKRAIYAEWQRLREGDKAVVAIPVDEETGEELEFEDAEALEAIVEGVLCSQVREAMGRLSEEERQLLEWHFGEELSEREIAARLRCSHVAVHKRLRSVWARLCGVLGVELPFPARRGKKLPKKWEKSE